MGKTAIIGIYLVVCAWLTHTAAAQTPSTQPATTPSAAPAVVPPVVSPPPPAGWTDGRPGVYWTPRAQYPQSPQYPPGREYFEPHETDFLRNHFELSLDGQGYTAFGHHGSDSLGFVSLQGSYFFLDGLSIGIEGGLSPNSDRRDYHHYDDGLRAEDVLALLRWHCINCGSLSFYGEVGAGDFHASPHFPSGAGSNNFLGVAGFGLGWRIASHLYVSGGARYARLQDWDDDDHHHHGSNGVQYYAGISFTP